MLLNDLSVRPGSRVVSVSGTSASVDEELFKVPGNIILTDDIVHKFVAFSNSVDGLRASSLKDQAVRKELFTGITFFLFIKEFIGVFIPDHIYLIIQILPSRIRREDDCFLH